MAKNYNTYTYIICLYQAKGMMHHILLLEQLTRYKLSEMQIINMDQVSKLWKKPCYKNENDISYDTDLQNNSIRN